MLASTLRFGLVPFLGLLAVPGLSLPNPNPGSSTPIIPPTLLSSLIPPNAEPPIIVTPDESDSFANFPHFFWSTPERLAYDITAPQFPPFHTAPVCRTPHSTLRPWITPLLHMPAPYRDSPVSTNYDEDGYPEEKTIDNFDFVLGRYKSEIAQQERAREASLAAKAAARQAVIDAGGDPGPEEEETEYTLGKQTIHLGWKYKGGELEDCLQAVLRMPKPGKEEALGKWPECPPRHTRYWDYASVGTCTISFYDSAGFALCEKRSLLIEAAKKIIENCNDGGYIDGQQELADTFLGPRRIVEVYRTPGTETFVE